MRKQMFLMAALVAASFVVISCGSGATNNAANAGNKAANSATAPAADKAAVEAEVKKVIEDFAAALNKNDAGAIEKFYADDYSLIDQNGVVHTKASRMEAIKGAKVKFEGMKFSDLKVRTHPAGDGAIVTANATGKATFDGKTEERNSLVTWVLGKSQDKGWQMLNAQITDIKGGDAAKADDKKADDKPADDKKAAPPAGNANN